MSLKNKVAIVTGASSGIGAAIAVKLTEEKAKVIIVGRNEVKLKNVSDSCETRGFKPHTIVADITQEDACKKIITETLNCFSKIDILVNNAGIVNSSSILDNKAMDIFDKVMTTNLRASVHLTHLAAKYLIETKGNIVNISSAASHIVMSKNSFSYCTSKAAMDHFTRCIALELAEHGVRVNSVNPGPVKSDILTNAGLDSASMPKFWDTAKKYTALNRVSEPEEVADIVAFIASEKAKSMTGSTILCDNGAVFNGTISTM